MAKSPRKVPMIARTGARILNYDKYHTKAGTFELELTDIRNNALAIPNVGWRESGLGFAGTASILLEMLSFMWISFCNSFLLLIAAINVLVYSVVERCWE